MAFFESLQLEMRLVSKREIKLNRKPHGGRQRHSVTVQGKASVAEPHDTQISQFLSDKLTKRLAYDRGSKTLPRGGD